MKDASGNDPHISMSNLLLDHLTDAVLHLDPDGRIRYANKACLNLVKFSEEELQGKDLGVLIPKDEFGNLKRHLRDVVDGKSTHSIMISANRKDSELLILNVLLVPIHEDGKVVGILLRAQDNTGTKRLETELNDTKTFLENIVSSAEEGFVTLNKDGIVLRWSKGSENICMVKPNRIIGRPFYTILSNKVQRRRFVDRIREVSSGRSLSGMEYEFLRDDEQVIHLSMSATPVLDRSGRIKEIIIILKDVTEKKHLEARLKESEKRLATEIIKKIEDLKYIEQLNRLVVQYMEEGAILLDGKLEIGFVNPKVTKILGYDENEMIGKSIEMVVPEDLVWVWGQIPDKAKRGSFRFESSFIKKDGEEVPVMVTASSIKVETKKSEFLCTIIDLSSQKLKEEEIREEMMEYKVRKGSSFLLMDSGYSKVADVLMTLKRFGHNILLLSRRSVQGSLGGLLKDPDTAVFWMEERGRGTRSILPEKDKLLEFFEEKVNRSTVMVLDRIDYLISKMTFQGLLNLLHSLVEIIYHRKAILLLLGDPTTVNDQMLRQIEKDAPLLEPKRAVILPDELQELLTYIFKQNRMGLEPSYKDIGSRFDITKTTTRKRIQQLLILELLIETKKGRTKVLRVSDRGRRFIPLEPSRL